MEDEEIHNELEILWTVKKTASYLNVNKITVYKWIKNGKIGFIKFGKSVRIPKSEIEKLVGVIQSKLANKNKK